MREKKVFITLALILGVLILGIAYAAITTQNLNVSGSTTATTSDANFDVAFTGEVDITKPTERADGTAITTIEVEAEASGKNGTITVAGLDTKGQEIIATYTVKNNSKDLKAILSLGDEPVDYDNTTWYTVTAELGSTTLEPEQSTTLTVKIKLIKTPATDADIEAATETFKVSFAANAT